MNIKELDIKDKSYLHLQQQIGSVFNTPQWLSIYDSKLKTFGIYDNGDFLIGFFNLYFDKVKGVSLLCTPPYSPYIALEFINPSINQAKKIGFNKSVYKLVESHITKIKSSIVTIALQPKHIDMQPFIWGNYKVIPNYTYQLSLDNLTEENLQKGFSHERRKNITKAVKDGVNASLSSDYEIVSQMIRYTFERKEKALKENIFGKIFNQFANTKNSYAYVSYQNKKPIAAVFVIFDKNVAYYLFGGYDPVNKHHGAGAIAMKKAILHANKEGIATFDFEGSMLKEVEKYFRGFGGNIIPYFTINKAKMMLEMVLKTKDRSKF